MTRASPRLRIGLGIATAGRPEILAGLLRILARQTRRPDRIVVCAPSRADAGDVAEEGQGVETLFGVHGLPAQRNAILDRMEDCEVVLFLDDDFIPDDGYVAVLERLHLAHPEVVMFTGAVLRDGVTTGGLSLAEALAALAEESAAPDDGLEELYNGYGCNMSVRRVVAARAGIRFDENLPLYGWLEDVDFSRALAPYGRIVRSRALRGVHLGIRSGRQRGLRLGYSQIANPIYILRKGNLSPRRALAQIGRNVAANLVRSLNPEPHVDRRGRIAGNALALGDLFKGRLSPDRILGL